MIDTQILQILREVVRTGNLTQAADKLFLTQSAVSHAIRRFEARHGVKLWERDGHRLRLTPTGDYLLGLANRVLPQLEYGAVILDGYARGRRGGLRIGMECHPCQNWLMRVIDPFLEDYPDVELDVTTAFQFGGLAALLGHEIDILVTPDPMERPGLEYIPVFDYELVLAVAETHPLAEKEQAEPQDFLEETLLTYPVPKEKLDIYTQFLVPAGVVPGNHRTVETTDLMMRLVASQRAVSSTPNWLVKEAPGVTSVRLGEGIHKQIHLGLRTGDRPSYMTGLVDIAANTKL